MFMLDAFIWRALLAGLGVAAVVGPLGCFVVWRRMAYFGDSLAHSALLGIALGLVAGIGMHGGIVLVCGVFALGLVALQHQRVLATDTLLGILAHAALSFGMVIISLMGAPPVDLHAYLFGDILTVSWYDIGWIYGAGTVVLALVWRYWSSLVLMTLHDDLARAEGVPVLLMQALLMLLMSLVVALSIQVVGILLITSLLIIPAATARHIARSPEGMAVIASVVGALAVAGGMVAAYQLDTPAGPSMVCVAVMVFVLSLGATVRR